MQSSSLKLGRALDGKLQILELRIYFKGVPVFTEPPGALGVAEDQHLFLRMERTFSWVVIKS